MPPASASRLRGKVGGGAGGLEAGVGDGCSCRRHGDGRQGGKAAAAAACLRLPAQQCGGLGGGELLPVGGHAAGCRLCIEVAL